MFFEGYNDSGFMADISNILRKYGLNQYLSDYVNELEFPSKQQGKLMVNKTVYQKEEQMWSHRLHNDPEFRPSDSVSYKTRYKSHLYIDRHSVLYSAANSL